MRPDVVVLASFWEAKNVEHHVGLQQAGHPIDLFLDSGAYSAWSKKVEISLQAYIDFIQAHPGAFTVYAGLDVIGDPRKTWENQQEMERQGLHPLPCYHYGEDQMWLKRYLGRYDYVALGGLVPISTPDCRRWLDRVFSDFLVDQKGQPQVKVHGFGMTVVELMLRYPWYSVDSTSWVLTGRFGSCYIPLNGKIHKVCFSDKSPNIREAGKHFRTHSRLEQKAIEQYLTEKGFTPKELAEQYQKRDELNIIFFLDLEKNWKTQPFRRGQMQPGFSLA